MGSQVLAIHADDLRRLCRCVEGAPAHVLELNAHLGRTLGADFHCARRATATRTRTRRVACPPCNRRVTIVRPGACHVNAARRPRVASGADCDTTDNPYFVSCKKAGRSGCRKHPTYTMNVSRGFQQPAAVPSSGCASSPSCQQYALPEGFRLATKTAGGLKDTATFV